MNDGEWVAPSTKSQGPRSTKSQGPRSTKHTMGGDDIRHMRASMDKNERKQHYRALSEQRLLDVLTRGTESDKTRKVSAAEAQKFEKGGF